MLSRKRLVSAALVSRIIHALWLLLLFLLLPGAVVAEPLQCGLAAVDVSPRDLPVIRNGGFLQAQDDNVLDPLHARCLVIDDGSECIAMVVVDSCMLPLDICDAAKRIAAEACDIAPSRILISATHTHSAPSVMDFCLGARADFAYRKFLPGKIAEAIQLAHQCRKPAQIGWVKVDASAFTKCRRWITRSDRWQLDPFGDRTVHANMHPGHENTNFVGPSGPVDPWLSLLSIQDVDGRSMGLFANFSMHYFGGHPGISADYYGVYAKQLEQHFEDVSPGFVGILSQGTSGDLWWGDYSQPKSQKSFQHAKEFADGLAKLSLQAVSELRHHRDIPIRMEEHRESIPRRVPDEKRLAWARRLNALRGDRLPENRAEVYALQAVHLHSHPADEVVLQAIQIGDVGITAMPNEVYGLTGLKLKRRSPLPFTFNVSLANGACGYIPPPEQHALGGYNTWPATTAGLEVAAEPRIVRKLLQMMERLRGEPVKEYHEPLTPMAKRVLQQKPAAFWRLADMDHGSLVDASSHGKTLRCDGMVAFHLPGRVGDAWGKVHESHAIQLAGGKLMAETLDLGESYSVQFSCWMGAPVDYRGVTAHLLSRGQDKLSVTGTEHETPGRLFLGGHCGETAMERGRWYHVVLIRNGDFVEVFLDGRLTPEISAKVPRQSSNSDEPRAASMILGGDRLDQANLEGKLDEVSVFDRALTREELKFLFSAAKYNDVPTGEQLPLHSQPKSPEESLQCIHVNDGFRVELVACEPLVQDPVAVDWGSDGKVWVTEMADYPMGIDGKGAPGGRIRVLEDRDHDGVYEVSTDFLEDVSFPNGVMAWQNGVLVTAAPDIFYAEDTDGDGRADRRETLLSGFMQGNQQLRVNGLRWGLDNLVHCASGAHHIGFGAGNVIHSTKAGKSITLGSRDFAFQPNTGWLVPQSGPSQYGRVRSDFGDWFGVQNSQPLWHYVLTDRYLRRNALVSPMDPRRQVRVPRMPQVFSAKPPQRRFHGFDHAGHYTSACGISLYRDELLFPREEVHAFTCEPFHNLVQHHVLHDDGVSFSGERGDDGPIDFFASTDRWTRPVMTRTAPDGSLWIVDMYRYMIEHPQWLPQEGKDALRPGYRAGDDCGRIFRVVRQGKASGDPELVLPLPDESQGDWLAKLQDRNGIVRDLAHRQLLLDTADFPLAQVKRIAATAPLPAVRIQAISLLAGKRCCDMATLETATVDSHPLVRRQAIRIAEKLHPQEVPECVRKLGQDPSPKVRLQWILSIGEWNTPMAGALFAGFAKQPIDDPYVRTAVISSLPPHVGKVTARLLGEFDSVDPLVMDAVLACAEAHPKHLSRLVQALLQQLDHRPAAAERLISWFTSLESRNLALMEFLPSVALEEVQDKIEVATEEIRRRLRQGLRVSPSLVGLLGWEPSRYEQDVALLSSAMEDPRTQDIAFSRLIEMKHEQVPKALLHRLPNMLPSLRTNTVAALLRRVDWQRALLKAVQDGTLGSHELTLAQRRTLLDSRDDRVAELANTILGSVESSREPVLARYRESVYLGDRRNGQRVFQKNCAVCHSLSPEMALVGPDLRALTSRTVPALLESILDPSRSIEGRFASYTFVLKDGKTLTGVVAEEAAGGVKVLDAEGRSHVVRREVVESTLANSKSIMPEGFERNISIEQMSDLLAYLQSI